MTDSAKTPLPTNIAKPAKRALAAVGIDFLEDVASATEAELGALHGMGPNALGRLRDALQAKGLDFRDTGS